MKKKSLALVLSAAMVAAMATGCSSSKPAETEAAATEAVTEKAAEKETEAAKATEAETEAATEAGTEKESETEAVTEAESEEAAEAGTEAVTEEESGTEAETEKAAESEAETEAVETEEVTEAAETEEATEAAESEAETEAAETEEVTEAAESEAETEAEETEKVTEAAESEKETEAAETEEETEAVETEAVTEAVTEEETETEAESEKAAEAESEEATEAESEEATEAESEEATEAESEEVTEAESEAVTEAADEETTEADTEEVTEVEAEVYDGEFTIGISQFAEHGSLDNCREGFMEGLASEGIVEGVNLTISYDNAQADTGTASTIAESYVSDGVDMICAIATPSAMSAYNAAMDTDIPVVYTAISDPVEAGLADEDGVSTGNVTGTSDKLPVEEQLKMIREILPEAEKIGILYTTSEANSISTIEEYKAIAGDYGFEIVDTGINTIADVDMAAADMVGKVDCISNLTDNTVVSALQTVLAYANEANIPVFGSEVEQVKNGCLASMGIDYVELGKQTGEMAAAILKGEATASEMNFEVCEGASLYVNTEEAEKLGIEFEEDYLAGAAEVFDTIVVE